MQNISNTNIDITSSLFQGTKFQMTLGRCPNFTFYLQKAPIPDIAIDEVVQPGPIVPVHRAGTKLYFGVLDIQVVLDENLRSWLEIYRWFRGLAPFSGDTNPLFPILKETDRYSDVTVTILNNANVPNIRFLYHNAYPTRMTRVDLDTKLEAGVPIIFDVTLRYTWFDPVLIGPSFQA